MKRILPFLALGATVGLFVASAAAQSLNYNNPYAITTLAGSTAGAVGSSDAAGTAAKFNTPTGIAVDGSGNLYVADTKNDVIRKIDTSGNVTTFAGTAGAAGEFDANGQSARFGPVYAVAVDGSGNIYVADWVTASGANATVRKITSSGSVSTFVPASVGLSQPSALAVDSSGNLYVADSGNSLIRKVTPAGAVSTFAGVQGQSNSVDGPVATAQFGYITGLAVDGAGNVYAADYQQDTIREISGGTVTTLAGAAGNPSEADGAASGATFTHPYGVASDAAGNLFVTDGGGLIREITAGRQVSTVAGSAVLRGNSDSSGQNATFNGPTGIAVNASDVIFVANSGTNNVRKGTAVGGSGAPTIATQPANATVQPGMTVMFEVLANGNNLTYQWKYGSTPLSDNSRVSGSQSNLLTIQNVSGSDAGSFTVTVTNASGTVTSNPATLSVVGTPPVISTSPASATVAPGGTANFTVTAVGTGLGYQWALNNVALSDNSRINGSNTANLSIANVGTADQGNYSVTVTNANGAVVSSAATLTVATSVVVKAHLLNLSTLAQTTPSSPLAVGFAVGGTGSKSLLIRGDGPVLSSFGVLAPLQNPVLGLYNQAGTVLASNTGWGTSVNPNPAALQAAFSQVQAFSLPSNSADSALLLNVAVGAVDSAQITGAAGTNTTGNALAEIYDADTAANPSGRLVNLSSRATVVGNSAPLSAGFVIGGTGTETLLIRGIGPGLAPLGVSGTLPTLSLSLVNANSSTPAVSQSNTGWNPSLAATFNQVGAFGLPTGSADCALLVTLPAGNYTATVNGTNGATGVALVEVYEVSSQ